MDGTEGRREGPAAGGDRIGAAWPLYGLGADAAAASLRAASLLVGPGELA